MSAIVVAARTAVGARFRLHGRDPSFGLDCVGLVAFACRAAGFVGVVPADYALRGGDSGTVAAIMAGLGLERAEIPAPGDVVLLATGPGQLHLAIDSGAGLIHADALLGRVVERPGDCPWPEIGRWRLAERKEER